MRFIRTRLTCSLLVGVLVSGCAATEWFSAPGVELRECSAGESESPGGVGPVSEAELAEVRDSLFGDGDAGEFVASLESLPGESERLVVAAAVVLDRLGDGEDLSRDDRRTVNQVLGLVGPRGAFAALKTHIKVDRLQQVLEVGSKRGVGERFLSCAVIGEGLAGGERVVLDAVMKASAVEGVSEDGREWLLAAMAARADDVFTTLCNPGTKTYQGMISVGVAVTDTAEAQQQLTTAFSLALSKAYVEATTEEQISEISARSPQGVGAIVTMMTREGARRDLHPVLLSRALTNTWDQQNREQGRTSWPGRTVLSDEARQKAQSWPRNTWLAETAENLLVLNTRAYVRIGRNFARKTEFQEADKALSDGVRAGTHPGGSQEQTLREIVKVIDKAPGPSLSDWVYLDTTESLILQSTGWATAALPKERNGDK